MSVAAAALLTLAAASVPKWQLAWSDEFDVPGAPDPKTWGYEKGYIRNHETQFYTEDRRENARVEGGRLILEARKDGFEGHPVTSASLTTLGKRDIRYGRVVVRAKIPTGRGTWPAIWTLGTDIGTVNWPNCGEIDIMENVGHTPDEMVFTTHRGLTPEEKAATPTDYQKSDGASTTVKDPWKGFHDYELRWYPDRLEQFMDGKPVHTYRKVPGAGPQQYPFDKPYYLILNLAIGGEWGGQKGIDDAIYPARFEIDWVKAYRQVP